MVTWNPSILDRYAAPGISRFTEASIPDVAGEFNESKHWLSNHFLNRAIGESRFKPPHALLVLNNLRATQFLFYEYSAARDLTLKYLASSDAGNPRLADYFRCVHHWSSTLLQYSIAVDTWNKFVQGLDPTAEKVFSSDDGSREQRAYQIAMAIKHTTSQKAEESFPVWLSNLGLISFSHKVSYPELADNLRDAGKMADLIQDPLTFAGGR
jgi:hypothetical protein